MTIIQMKYFESVARNKSILKASKECFVSSSAISKTLIDLEKDYEITFFKKDNNIFILTTAGEVFLEKIKVLLSNYNELEFLLNSFKYRKKSITVGVPYFLIFHPFQNFVIQLFNKFKNLDFRITEMTSLEIFKKIENNEIDFGFIIKEKNSNFFSNDNIEMFVIDETILNFCVNQNHPVAKERKITINEIEQIPIAILKNNITTIEKSKKIYTSLDLKLNVELITTPLGILLELIVKRQCGTFFLNKYLPQKEELFFLEIDPEIKIQIVLVYQKSYPKNKSFDKLINYIKQNYKEIIESEK